MRPETYWLIYLDFKLRFGAVFPLLHQVLFVFVRAYLLLLSNGALAWLLFLVNSLFLNCISNLCFLLLYLVGKCNLLSFSKLLVLPLTITADSFLFVKSKVSCEYQVRSLSDLIY